MRMTKMVSVLLTMVLTLTLLSACSSTGENSTATPTSVAKDTPVGDAKKKVTIGVAINSTENEYWVQEAEGAKVFAATLPAGTADVQILTNEGNDEKQLNGIKSLIASAGKNTILYVDPSNASNTAAIAELCEESGVYWTSVWHIAPGLNPNKYKYYVAHQSVDGVKQGYDIAIDMFKKFKTPGKGKILAIQGLLGNDSAVERYAGLKKALAENPGVELLDMQVADWSPQKALTITETWLSKYKDIDGIWSANDGMALAAVQALKAKDLNGKVQVVGVDGVSAALKAVEDGDMAATVANNGWLQGGYGAAYAYDAYIGKIDPSKMPAEKRAFYTEGFFINKESLPEYKKKFVDNKPVYDFNNLDVPIVRPMVLK
ncbi:sugar ABC transporter substrate-binding protein [Paenibacillus frigoriresistens]|uniref:sugar ABC transporter substrate-binding protein n=1 Tax=Paenibacillus alginolyticus TaxID=59839 RepID=UPI00156785CB|nr:sugar ABC transporter substrate-binding protein [Paenibacillus frigoriresistens]NRF95103.1 sugar ABC transporter substrate-binding protein [Paenibacillus frigoriresistens]